MSTWHATAIERLGTPDPSWASILGPDAAAVAALRTLDLTPSLYPLESLSQELERQFLRASLGEVSLTLKDADGSLAAQLGPASTLLATSTRYAGPWVRVWESWAGGASTADRFFGYVDESSIQWSEVDGTTTLTVYAAAQLLAERKLADLDAIKRPYPPVPSGSATTFSATTADAALQAEQGDYVPRSNALALEQALWALGSLTWYASVSEVHTPTPEGGDRVKYYPPPAAEALTVVIDGQVYAVESVSWDSSISYGTESVWRPCRLNLAGTPNLAGILSVGTTVTWSQPESALSHYQLAADIPAPTTGQEGQSWAQLRAVGGLVAGDKLTVTYAADGKVASDDWLILDVDGETNRVWLKNPIQHALNIVQVRRIRRNSQDPILVDGVALLGQIVAPWPVDTTHLLPAVTDQAVLTWLPVSNATPEIYGATDIQALDRAGRVRISRRGATDASGDSPTAGCWEGSVEDGWTWVPSTDAALPARQLAQLAQWPGGSNDVAPPALWIDGDLSGGLAIPPNGWRRLARSFESPSAQIPAAIWQTWDGAALSWASHAASGSVPSRLVHFVAQAAAAGRIVVSGGTWTWEAHSGAGTLGSPSTVTPTGLPSGSLVALGLGAYLTGGAHQEAVLALYASGSAPWTSATAALLSVASGGALTVRTTQALTTPQGGPWAVAGGLVLCTYPETLGGVSYPHTRLWAVTGGTLVEADLPTLEIIPGTVHPLVPVSGLVPGWMALAMESYQDGDGALQRRARLVHLDASLQIVNGDPEPSPAGLTDSRLDFRRGALVAGPLPPGSVIARMVRTGLGNQAVGILGGRLFQVDTQISRVLERVSLENMTALDYLERVGQVLLATGIPQPDGSISLVSRRSGTLRSAILPGQEGRITSCPVGSWVGEVRVSYSNLLESSSEEAVAYPARSGGKVLSMDLQDVLASPGQSQAIAASAATHWGVPVSLRTATWTDPSAGVQATLAPPFWGSYLVGDRIPVGTKTYKLMRIDSKPEEREAEVELLEIPGGGA